MQGKVMKVNWKNINWRSPKAIALIALFFVPEVIIAALIFVGWW